MILVKKSLTFLLTLFVTSLSTWATSTKSQRIHICGSDYMEPVLREIFKASPFEAQVTLDLKGTHDGMRKAAGKQADILIILRSNKDAPQIPGYESTPYCYEAPVVMVPKKNPIKSISLTMLNTIYASEDKAPPLWSTLVNEPALMGKKIRPCILLQPKSMGWSLIKHEILKGKDLNLNVKNFSNAERFQTRLSEETATLALSCQYMKPKAFRTLAVSKDDHSIAYLPLEENFIFADYPLTLTFECYIRNEKSTLLNKCIELLHSEAAYKAICHAGYSPANTIAKATL